MEVCLGKYSHIIRNLNTQGTYSYPTSHVLISVTMTSVDNFLISVTTLPMIYNELILTGVTADNNVATAATVIDRNVETYAIANNWFQVHFEATSVDYVILYTFYKDFWGDSGTTTNGCSCCTGNIARYRDATCGEGFKKESKLEVLLGASVTSTCGNWGMNLGTSLASQTTKIECKNKPVGDSVKVTKTESTKVLVAEIRVVKYMGKLLMFIIQRKDMQSLN